MPNDAAMGFCESCLFEPVLVRTYPHPKAGERQLCAVCAGTLISNDTGYHTDNARVLATIGYCTNLILARLDRMAQGRGRGGTRRD